MQLAFDEEKSVLLVDGQQRTAALSMVPVEAQPIVPLSVNAMVANDDRARQIFTIANSTQKIATDFSRALLATMDEVPPHLRKDRIPANVTRLLALKDPTSPFFEIVKYPGAVQAGRPMAFNTLFLAASEFASSSLYPEDEPDAERVADHMKRAFSIVKQLWPEAWGVKPTESRLTHAAGIRALTGLMIDELEYLDRSGSALDQAETWVSLKEALDLVAPSIAWRLQDVDAGNATQAKNWENEISKRQNTNQDITELTNFLKKQLKKARANA